MRVKIFHWTIPFFLLWVALPAGSSCETLAQEGPPQPAETSWQAHVGEYRKGHNLGLSTVFSRGCWQMEVPSSQNTRSAPSESYGTMIQYSYHFQLIHGLGYFLGSSFGYLQETKRADLRVVGFRPISTWQLPGLQVGLSMNFTPRLRLMVGGDIHMERMENFTVLEEVVDKQTQEKQMQEKQISATLHTWPDAFVALDIFYKLRMAVRLEAHRRVLLYKPPRNSSGKSTDISLRKEDRWVGIGLVFHDL